MKLSTEQQNHLMQEENTRKLIQYLIKMKQINTYEDIYALCSITWWSQGFKPKIDGYNYYFNTSYSSMDEILDNEKDPVLKKLLSKNTGFVNFYKAYRNSSRDWIKKNFNNILDIIHDILNIENDEDILVIAYKIEELPKIFKPNEKKDHMHPESLLTPLLSCIDPLNRFPIVNKANHVKKLERLLQISNLSLREKVKELLIVLNENKLPNAFYLDVLNEKLITKKIKERIHDIKIDEKELSLKDDKDINFVKKEKRITVIRNHRMLEKFLYRYCAQKKLKLYEGGINNRYDALIKNFDGKGNDLLIEIKGSISDSEIRLAIGQILDYEYELKRKVTKAIMLPSKPKKKFIDIMKQIEINCIWIHNNKLTGNIHF